MFHVFLLNYESVVYVASSVPDLLLIFLFAGCRHLFFIYHLSLYPDGFVVVIPRSDLGSLLFLLLMLCNFPGLLSCPLSKFHPRRRISFHFLSYHFLSRVHVFIDFIRFPFSVFVQVFFIGVHIFFDFHPPSVQSHINLFLSVLETGSVCGRWWHLWFSRTNLIFLLPNPAPHLSESFSQIFQSFVVSPAIKGLIFYLIALHTNWLKIKAVNEVHSKLRRNENISERRF